MRPQILLLALMLSVSAIAQNRPAQNPLRQTNPEFFKSAEAARVGEQILLWQRVTGGWPKNVDMTSPMSEEQKAAVLSDKNRTDDSTIDNNATSTQMRYLAQIYQATGESRYREGFIAGVEYLLSGQYDNGGWPQYWPQTDGYQEHITFNDNAIVNTLALFADIRDAKEPYGGKLVDSAMRRKLAKAFDKGIDCILKTQIVKDGKLTVWCQQHYRDSYAPAPARAFELPSYCSAESVGIVRLLMSLPKPNKEVKTAVHAAMKWFDTYKIKGYKVVRTGSFGGPRDTRLVEDAAAPALWGRFYDLQYTEPFICDRDGIARRRLEQIGRERRSGYSWYNSSAAELYPMYEAWASKHDPTGKVAISLDGPGANQNGTIDMFRKPIVNRDDFNAIVSPGQSIQEAIEKAPIDGAQPYKILVLNGTYEQKIIIDRPNIVLVGESREGTKLILAEGPKKRSVATYKGRPAGNGVISIWAEGRNCTISGFTIYNNYGTTIENTTSHQFAIFGRADKTIVINCNVWSDGNDTIALWAEGGNGMYYHADLDVRCPGVDFLCPRGWCYATRCTITGDTPDDAPAGIRHAMIWHDGRGDQSKRFVITNSDFDAKRPTLLGRYHHDSEFYLVNCVMSENIIDHDIAYAYTDKVLDPCPWGHRVYYLSCFREGGNSGWLKNNVPAGKTYYNILPSMVFGKAWDPEQTIRELWYVLAY